MAARKPPWIAPIGLVNSGFAVKRTWIVPCVSSIASSWKPSSAAAGGAGLRPSITSQKKPLRADMPGLLRGVRRLARLPDVLGGPGARPLERCVLRVGGGRAGRRPQLDQILDDEPVPAEEADPGAVGTLEGDGVPGRDPRELEVGGAQGRAEAIRA